VPDKEAPVIKCYRYIKNRPGKFDYKGALEDDLPRGSGEIESAHRSVIQERSKIAEGQHSEEPIGPAKKGVEDRPVDVDQTGNVI
jgi:hypothetical protein